jgi:hypothetical protein
MRSPSAILLLVWLAAPESLLAQGGVPQGPEFRINTYYISNQRNPIVASDASGDFVVVWDALGIPFTDIQGQRYSAGGVPLGGEFKVNSFTTAEQNYPSVASDSAGNFVVVWWGQVQYFGTGGVFGRRFASTGAPLGPDFQVSTSTLSPQDFPAVASDATGNFVVVWKNGQDGSSSAIFGQRYANTGVPLGAEFRVNSYTTGGQGKPSVASDPAGNFVVAWTSGGQDGSSSGVFAQRFSSAGVPLGGEFRVNTYTALGQNDPSIASDSSGYFVIVWTSDAQDGSTPAIFGQCYAATGVPQGAEFRVNSYTTGSQGEPSVAIDADGNFVVVWSGFTQNGIFGQRFASDGMPLGGEFRVNTDTLQEEKRPAVASDTLGRFVVAWQVDTDGDYGSELFGQRYGPIVPVQLDSLRIE